MSKNRNNIDSEECDDNPGYTSEMYPSLNIKNEDQVEIRWGLFSKTFNIKELADNLQQAFKYRHLCKKLKTIRLCDHPKCTNLINELTPKDVFEIHNFYLEDYFAYLPEVVLKLCKESRKKFYDWITDDLYELDRNDAMPFDIAIMEAKKENLENILFQLEEIPTGDFFNFEKFWAKREELENKIFDLEEKIAESDWIPIAKKVLECKNKKNGRLVDFSRATLANKAIGTPGDVKSP